MGAGADLARRRRGPGLQPPRQGRHIRGRQTVSRRRRRRLRRPRPAGRRREPRSARRRGCRALRARCSSSRQAGRRHLPRPVDAGRGRRRRGRTLTCWPTLQTDIANAGGHWVDEEVHVDEGLIDLPQARRPAGVLREVARCSPRASIPARRAPRLTHGHSGGGHRRDNRGAPTTITRSLGTARSPPSCRCGASTGTSRAATSWFAAPAGEMGSTARAAMMGGRAAEKVLYTQLIGEVEPLAGARAVDRGSQGPRDTSSRRPSPAKPEELELPLRCSMPARWSTRGPPRTRGP